MNHRDVRLFDAGNRLQLPHHLVDRFRPGHAVAQAYPRGFEHGLSADFAQAVGIDRGDRLLRNAHSRPPSKAPMTSIIALIPRMRTRLRALC